MEANIEEPSVNIETNKQQTEENSKGANDKEGGLNSITK